MVSGKIILLSFIFLCIGDSFSFPDLHQSDIGLKWYIKKDQNHHFIVTVDAGKVNRYIQLSELRFAVDFTDIKGNLISRDTLDFSPSPAGEDSPVYYLQGGSASSRTFTHYYGSNVKLTGIKLLYNWYDTSLSTQPDPYEEKIIIEEMIYGEGSVDVSDSPD